MADAFVDSAVSNARAVGNAATALARALKRDPAAVADAADELELQSTQAIELSQEGFDADQPAATEEDRLALSVSSLGIGLALFSAEVSVANGDPDRLVRSARLLEQHADELEAGSATAAGTEGFDTAPDGVLLGRAAAALAALDEMAASAAEVVTSVLDKAFKPLVDKLPEQVTGIVEQLDLDLGGRLARLGLRAVRRGLQLLMSVVDIGAVERARHRVDELLARLGSGEDAAVLAGWAIGVDSVRESIAGTADPSGTGHEAIVQELAALAQRYASICASLKRVIALVVGLAGLLALLHVTLPHALVVTSVGLGLALGAAVVIGRDFTGASDLPGRVEGVLRVLTDVPRRG